LGGESFSSGKVRRKAHPLPLEETSLLGPRRGKGRAEARDGKEVVSGKEKINPDVLSERLVFPLQGKGSK